MTSGVNVYNDFKALGELRARAAQDAPAATREAARQFEALFVQMMLKSMRQANDTFGDKEQDTTYREMFDQQISLEMTKGRGLGLADMLVRQIGGQLQPGNFSSAGMPAAMTAMLSRAPAGTAASLAELSGLPEPQLADLPIPAAPAIEQPVMAGREDWRPDNRQQFVRDIWPLAVRAARQLNVDPRAIVAQAALETGWGSRMVRDDAGISGNNLFNIKADQSWSGERLAVTTLEYEDGLPKPQRAQFRAYSSLAEGFDDYVRFLKDNPRYSDALRGGASAEVYAERLQSAGYATDPRYAEKIRGILASPVMQPTAATLKAGGDVPTYL